MSTTTAEATNRRGFPARIWVARLLLWIAKTLRL
jgi:hypothetical protein